MSSISSREADHIDQRYIDVVSLDSRINAVLNQLASSDFITSIGTVAVPPNNKIHHDIRCCRETCMKRFTAASNSKDAYHSVISHVVLHCWDAGKYVSAAVRQYVVNNMLNGLPDDSQTSAADDVEQFLETFISPDRGTKRRRSPTGGSPIRSGSIGGNATTDNSQSTDVAMVMACEKIDTYKLLARMIAAQHLPITVFDGPVARQFLQAGGFKYQYSREEVTVAVNNTGAKVRQETIDMLKRENMYVTMAVDSVTNTNHHKIYNTMLLCNGVAYYWTSDNIQHDRDTTDTIATLIGNHIETLRQHNIRIIALVTDSASNILAAKKKIADKYNIIPISCAAHLLHNSAMEIIKSSMMAQVFDAFNAFIKAYHDVKDVRRPVSQQCRLTILRAITTRWSSHYTAYKRIIGVHMQLQQIDNVAVQQVLPQPNQVFAMSDILKLLELYQKHTNVVQSDSATLLDMYDAVITIKNTLKMNYERSDNLHPLLRNAEYWRTQHEYLINRFNNLDSVSVTWFAAFITGSTERDLSPTEASIRQWLLNNAMHILTNIQIGDTNSTLAQVILQFEAFCQKAGRWRMLASEYSGRGTRLRNPAAYFRDRRPYSDSALFAEICIAVLSIIPSEASVERMFSSMKQTWSARRNRLSMKTINNLLMIRQNADLLDTVLINNNDNSANHRYQVIDPNDLLCDTDDDDTVQTDE